MVYFGALLSPRQSLNNRGRRHGHHPAAPGGRADGGWLFYNQLGSARGPGSGRVGCGSHGLGGAQRHVWALPSMSQNVIEGQQDVVHALRRTGGGLPYHLHPGNRPLSSPEHGGMGCTTQHGPLLGPELRL